MSARSTLVRFAKMHGAGNDFIVFDARELGPPEARLVQALCDRRRGIGADGILRVNAFTRDRIEVDYLNRDGGEAFCGNGTRCAVRFARARGLIDARATAATAAGLLRVRDEGADVEVEMPRATIDPDPLVLPASDDVPIGQRGFRVTVGVPHLVVPATNVAHLDVAALGPRYRRDPRLGPEGANVDFVEVLAEGRLRLRTFERGVEGETLACGTGAVAAAHWHAGTSGANGSSFEVAVETRSGATLRVRADADGAWLIGPVAESYVGEVDLARLTGER